MNKSKTHKTNSNGKRVDNSKRLVILSKNGVDTNEHRAYINQSLLNHQNKKRGKKEKHTEKCDVVKNSRSSSSQCKSAYWGSSSVLRVTRIQV